MGVIDHYIGIAMRMEKPGEIVTALGGLAEALQYLKNSEVCTSRFEKITKKVLEFESRKIFYNERAMEGIAIGLGSISGITEDGRVLSANEHRFQWIKRFQQKGIKCNGLQSLSLVHGIFASAAWSIKDREERMEYLKGVRKLSDEIYLDGAIHFQFKKFDNIELTDLTLCHYYRKAYDGVKQGEAEATAALDPEDWALFGTGFHQGINFQGEPQSERQKEAAQTLERFRKSILPFPTKRHEVAINVSRR
jgi:hypothetical protein